MKDLSPGAVFLDLVKAFDTVNHQRLILKLYSIGFSSHSVRVVYIKSYLENRCQVTTVGNVYSSSKPVPVGVPQGSILGPLLFLVYVNDLPSCLRECDLTLYTDDTVIYVSAKDAATLESRLNIDLQSISKWFFGNLLTLNENNCKFVLFGSLQKLKSFKNFSLCINDYNLERTDSFKYLGVTISQNMTWQDHISLIVNKVNQRLGVLRRVKQMLPLQSRRTLHNSLVLPLFDYGDIVWGDKNNFTLMDNLQILQNKACEDNS